MKRFLAATDGSRHGDQAVAVGYALAQRAHGEFTRFAVEWAVPEAPEPGWRKHRQATGETETYARGLPGVEIVHRADSWGADLVVLGRSDRSPEQPLPLGPTSDAVIRRRTGASLFVPLGITTLQRGLIALDGSPRGFGVLAPAVALLNVIGSAASAICVLPGSEAESGDPRRDPRSQRVRSAVERLELAAGPCDLLLRWGDPVARIQAAIRETGADFLVLGVRRGGPPGDLGSGHVGRDLLKSVPSAVLTVPI